MTRPPINEQGVALVAVLALVLTLSGLAAVSLNILRDSTSAAQRHDRAGESLLLARSGGEVALRMAAAVKNTGRATRAGPAEMTLPLDGATLSVVLQPLPPCFNLNSLAPRTGDSRAEQAPATDPARFEALLKAAGLPPIAAGNLARATARALQRGVLFADASEWRAVPGVGGKEWQRLAPFLCALPSREPYLFDKAALTPAMAPLRATLATDPGSQDGEKPTDPAPIASRWMTARVTVTGHGQRVVRALLIDTAKTPPAAAGERWLLTDFAAEDDA